MFRLPIKFSAAAQSSIFRAGLVVFLVLASADVGYSTCSLGGTITTDSTITGTCTLVEDLYVSSTATVTIVPPCTLYVAALSDSRERNLGADTLRLEILVAGIFRIAGDSTPSGRVVIRSDSGRAGDWFGIRRVDTAAQIKVNYAELVDGDITVFTYRGVDSILNSRFENWRTHAIANTNELGSQGPPFAAALTSSPDNLVIRSSVFSSSNEAIRFTHNFGVVIDSNSFLNQESLAVYLDDYAGTITRNYFFAANGFNAIRASGTGASDSTTIAQNIIKGYYTSAHIFVYSDNPPFDGFRIRGNKFITGQGTQSSLYGLRTTIVGKGATSYKLVARDNIFSQFDSTAIFSDSYYAGVRGDDFGNSGTGSPGNNVFLLPCNPSAKAIKRVGGATIPAEGNWYARDTITNADSANMFEGGVDFRPYLTAPAIPFFGRLGRTSTWAAGNDTLEGDFILDSCATLTLSPGARVLALANQDLSHAGGDTAKSEFIAKGTVNSFGTQTDSILFSSAAASPARGDWGGVLVDTFGRGSMGFTRVSYADTALKVLGDTASVNVRNSTFTHFKTMAVFSRSAKTDLGNKNLSQTNCGKNNFLMKTAQNGALAVVKSALPSGTLYAEGNWWDSTSPPAAWFAGSVDYSPYLRGMATRDSCPAGGGGGGCEGGDRLCLIAEQVDGTRPLKFELGQNYPNPFNAATLIRFSLAQPSRVELRIYNILGQPVRTLVDEKSAGVYEVLWDGRDEHGVPVSSGTYLYQIRAGDFVETKKMQLIK